MLAAGPLSCDEHDAAVLDIAHHAGRVLPGARSAQRFGPERHAIAMRCGGEQSDAVDLPVRRAEQRRGLPNESFQQVVGAGQLPVSFLLRDLAEIRVAPGMITDLVPLIAGAADEVRVGVRMDAHREERRRDAAPSKGVENHGGVKSG